MLECGYFFFSFSIKNREKTRLPISERRMIRMFEVSEIARGLNKNFPKKFTPDKTKQKQIPR
jgi:hypothetical protein